MNQIATSQWNLPDKIEDLARFALIGREKMTAVRAEIRAIEKLGLAEEVRRQKLEEAQLISEAVLDAEVRIGTLTAALPKAAGGDRRSVDFKTDTAVDFEKPTKAQAIESIGFTPKQVERFETLARHPEVVEQAKAEARERDDIVSRAFVLQKVQEAKRGPEPEVTARPFVAHNSGENEWYTPAVYIEAAREAMGSIDTDPASCEHANKTVRAGVYYSIDDDGLAQEWRGNVWMNPPYSGGLVAKFAEKLNEQVEAGNATSAVVLVNNATETQWFAAMCKHASAIIFPTGRIRFLSVRGEEGTPLQGQAFIYAGNYPDKFLRCFARFGWGARLSG